MDNLHSSEITPEYIYLSRRKFMLGVGSLVGAAFLVSACRTVGVQPSSPGADFCSSVTLSKNTDELGQQVTSCKDITNYNNFYEFSLGKDDIGPLTANFKPSPWQVQVGGLVNNPHTYTMEEILQKFPQEERIYRMRCVEAWSMVIPWLGFPLSQLLNEVGPTSQARFVRFETLYDPRQMPGQNDPVLNWPYVEGLRLDEGMHDLTILATGLYGKPLPNQDGAPIRLVVPWKYGLKSIKSIVKIDLVAEMPISAWTASAPTEYGFYSNVNPDVPHPRWPQSSERRIGESDRRKTLLFNGYSQVASLYTGMDLKLNF